MIFFKQRKPMRKGGKKPESQGEEGGSETYEERMDGIARWNIEHTDPGKSHHGERQRHREDGPPFSLYHLWNKVFAKGKRTSGNDKYHEVEALGVVLGGNSLYPDDNGSMPKDNG